MNPDKPEKDVYTFDPTEWLDREIGSQGGAATVEKRSRTSSRGSREANTGNTSRRQLIREVWRAHEGQVVDGESPRTGAVEQFAGQIRADEQLLGLIVEMVAQHLGRVYRHKLEQTASNPADWTLSDHNKANLPVVIQSVFEAACADGFDVWRGLDALLFAQVVALGLDLMEQELGVEATRALSEAERHQHLGAYLESGRIELFEHRIEYVMRIYAPELARFVIDSLDLRDASVERLERLLGIRPLDSGAILPSRRRKAPRELITVMLTHGHLTVMSNAHYHAVREALYKNTFREVEGSPWPTAALARGGALGQAQLRPPLADEQPILPTQDLERLARMMWQQREELSDLDADVLDALSAMWLHQAKSVQDRAVADVDALLAMRGIKPKMSGTGRRGGYEPEQRAEIMRALAHVQSLWLNMAELEVYEQDGNGRRQRPTKKTIQSRPFIITDRLGQLRMDGFMDVEQFIFRPGEVFAHFLMGPGHQTALLSAKALKYDRIRQMWEKRLARYLSWQWRTKARSGEYVCVYRASTLLDAIGVQVDLRRPSQTRDHLERTLDRLQSDEVIAAWQYDRWDEETTIRRGWAHEWSQTTILIEPPDVVKEQYQRLERRDTRHQQPALPEGLAARIKRRRTELRQTQLQAAEALEISQAHFSRLERGRATESSLTQATLRKLREWLGPPPS